jgi:hypothetical protein
MILIKAIRIMEKYLKKLQNESLFNSYNEKSGIDTLDFQINFIHENL